MAPKWLSWIGSGVKAAANLISGRPFVQGEGHATVIPDNPEGGRAALHDAAEALDVPAAAENLHLANAAEHLNEGAVRAAVDGRNSTIMTDRIAAEIPAMAQAGRQSTSWLSKAGSFAMGGFGLAQVFSGIGSLWSGVGAGNRAMREGEGNRNRAINEGHAAVQNAQARQTQANGQATENVARAGAIEQDQAVRDTIRGNALAQQTRQQAPATLTAEERAAEAMARKGIQALRRKAVSLARAGRRPPAHEQIKKRWQIDQIYLYAVVLGSTSLSDQVAQQLETLVLELQAEFDGRITSICTASNGLHPAVGESFSTLLADHYLFHQCADDFTRTCRMMYMALPVILFLTPDLSPLQPMKIGPLDLLPTEGHHSGRQSFSNEFWEENEKWIRLRIPYSIQRAPIHVLGIEERKQPQVCFQGTHWGSNSPERYVPFVEFQGTVFKESISLEALRQQGWGAENILDINDCFTGLAFEQEDGTIRSKPFGGYEITYAPIETPRPAKRPKAGATPPPSYTKVKASSTA